MNQRHIRNRLYISAEEQELIKNTPILLGGAGIGSVIAECLLRLGFETLTIIDGDVVELSNLNRQNYTEKDISKPKVEALKERLLAINSEAKITIHNCFLTPENVEGYINEHKIAINALDFSSDVPLLFDSICQKNKIPVLHPYNLGWGALVLVISDAILLHNPATNQEAIESCGGERFSFSLIYSSRIFSSHSCGFSQYLIYSKT